jgi:hypothetical protein
VPEAESSSSRVVEFNAVKNGQVFVLEQLCIASTGEEEVIICEKIFF